MTIRVQGGTIGASTQSQAWYLFYWLTRSSPTGPGWVSKGEGDGTTGGMGTTGIITGTSDFSSNNTWFVLAPTSSAGAKQVLIVKTGINGWRYSVSRGGNYTGGGATTPPTATDELTIWNSSSYADGSTNYHYLVADDASPYGWCWFCVAPAQPSSFLAHIPMNVSVSGDTDPYVHYGAVGVGFTYYISSTAGLGVVSATTTYRTPKAYNPSGTGSGGVAAAAYYYSSNSYLIPTNNGVMGVGSKVFGAPIAFMTESASSPSFFKGITTFLRWKGSSMPNGTLLGSKTYAVVGDILLPWDGSTPFII